MLLYIHIPFCDSKCHYCSFNSYVDKFDQISAYMDSLYIQFEHELNRFNTTNKSITSVFIGGGTPSTVEPKLYEKLFARLKPFLANDVEITTEANPNSASTTWLKGMKKLGCTRVSFGVQSFNDTKLKFLGREHTSQQALKAIQAAHDIGFEHLSLDLIYATKMDTKEILEDDIKTAFSLPIDHISAYALTIEENTLFAAHPEVAKEKLELTTFFIDSIKNKGFEHYEISNFGTYQCKHNIGYWELDDYMGVGSGAVGMLKNKRFYPSTDIDNYIKNPLDIRTEDLSMEDLKTEKIFLGLRSNVGININALSSSEKKQVDILLRENKVNQIKNTIYNTDFLLSDEIALFIQS
ncbi:coproporphyrinogen III oxidase family protein [Sulfurimonas sp. MAG313]|nr:radical SAM family heme chaperone HemW [Sulfurimonas sp. MAG313]MDF1879713.1 coproporphyrinogen III oxidase family protein [Sulfurimonas sp. MAG313]